MEHLNLPVYSEVTYELLAAILDSAIIGWLVLMKHLGPQLALTLVLAQYLVLLKACKIGRASCRERV